MIQAAVAVVVLVVVRDGNDTCVVGAVVAQCCVSVAPQNHFPHSCPASLWYQQMGFVAAAAEADSAGPRSDRY